MLSTSDYKISMFSRVKNNKLYNDYLDNHKELKEDELKLVKKVLEDKNVDLRLILKYEFEWLIDNKVIVLKKLNELEMFYPYHVDIETSTGCNFSCKFCPQSITPKRNSVMSMDNFKTIIDKLDDYHVNYIIFQHYNEPLLDPYFFNRLDYITSKNIKLYLYTNAMYLSEEVTNKLNNYDLYGMNINFPSINREEWADLTNQVETNQIHVLNNIIYFANNYGRNLQEFQISINGNSEHIQTKSDDIRKYLSNLDLKKIPILFNCESHSRAGNIENEYVVIKEKRTEKKFKGCKSINSHLHISHKADIFLCCQDYHQEVILGNLLTNSLQEIMSSEKAQKVRGMLYGVYPMDNNMICRNCLWLR